MENPNERLNVIERLSSSSIAGALGLLAAMRQGKAVHPRGVVHAARLRIPGDVTAPPARLLREPGDYRAIVRFSRSLGLPQPWPDLLGMAIRVLDAYGRGRHQDLMLISSIDRPVLHHVFVPARDVWQAPFSSALPYRAGAEQFLLGALGRLHGPRPAGDSDLERLDSAAAAGQLDFRLAVAGLNGRFRPVGELSLGRRLAPELDALCFNPWNTGGGLEPAGWLNNARFIAYRRSQAAWRRTQPDGVAHQAAAEAALATFGAEAAESALAPTSGGAPFQSRAGSGTVAYHEHREQT